MKYVIKIKAEKQLAFLQILEGLVAGGVIESFSIVKEEKSNLANLQIESKEKSMESLSARIAEQYRDLVD